MGKGFVDKVESAATLDDASSRSVAKHADRAFSLVGNERVKVTEEDVCYHPEAYLSPEERLAL